jgi:hypothetical protein
VQAIGEGRRSRQAALAAVHADLTVGEVAAARHAIGTFRYTQDGGRRPGRVLDEDAMRAYFVILWALERGDNTLSCYSSGNQRRASGLIGWNLDELTRNVVWFRRQHGGGCTWMTRSRGRASGTRCRSDTVSHSMRRADG